MRKRLFIIGLILSFGLWAEPPSQLNVAYFTQDPPTLVSLSPSFDPDSYAVISQLFDSLIYFDLDGNIKPGLATDWQQESERRWRFKLRKGVRFHNGERFDARAVKFTYDYILDPKNNAGNRWILSSIKRVLLVKDDPYQIVIETRKPDNMLLNRLNMFGAICPPQYIREKGFDYFARHPVGTGPFVFNRLLPGKAVLLDKNPDYWQKHIPHYDRVQFKIIPQKGWIEALAKGEVDLVPNFPGNRTTELMQNYGDKIRLIKRLVLAGYWVLIHNEGIFADLKVRKALNYAVNKQDLIRFGDFGNAVAMSSLGKKQEFGANEKLAPYRYDPDRARTLLKEAKVKPHHPLSILAADITEPVARIIESNLEDVGFDVTLQVVSRSEWSKRVIAHKLATGERAPYDMVINLVDNPIYHLGFHAGLFLDSRSPWSQIHDPEFDRRFDLSLQQTAPGKAISALQALDAYIHDNALMLFATQRIITVAVSKKTSIDTFGLNGHLDYELLSKAKQVTHD